MIRRELQLHARQSFTYKLRMLGGAAPLAAWLFFGTIHDLKAGSGGLLFNWLHFALFWAIWALVPMSASDCISRERREGTLGFLFLTPLKSWDVVVALGLTQGLRALMLWAAALPVMIIPFLLGGLPWQCACVSCVVNFSSICLALGASLCASTLCRERHRALILAFLIELIPLVALILGVGAAYIVAGTGSFNWRADMPPLDLLLLSSLELAQFPLFGAQSNLPPADQRAFLEAMGGVIGLSVLCACALLLLAAWRVGRNWRDQPPPAWVASVRRIFCTPMLLRGLLRRWMRWKLERNPVGWLEQRTWSGRLVVWSWLAVLASIYSACFGSPRFYLRSFQFIQDVLAVVLVINVSATASGSFRRERENGVMELLLVAPLGARRIIGGRLWGIWGQFLPAMALLWGVWFYFGTFARDVHPGAGAWWLVFLATTPVIGLYYSLAESRYVSALLWTLFVSCAVPLLVLLGMRIFFPVYRFWPTGPLLLVPASQLALGIFFFRRLRRNLEQRRFAIEGIGLRSR